MGSWFGGSSSVYVPTPSTAAGATDVSSGTTSDSEAVLSKALERQRRRRGVASTIRASQSSDSKDKLGG